MTTNLDRILPAYERGDQDDDAAGRLVALQQQMDDVQGKLASVEAATAEEEDDRIERNRAALVRDLRRSNPDLESVADKTVAAMATQEIAERPELAEIWKRRKDDPGRYREAIGALGREIAPAVVSGDVRAERQRKADQDAEDRKVAAMPDTQKFAYWREKKGIRLL